MEGSGSRRAEHCPQLLDLIPKHTEWLGDNIVKSSSDERELELRLGVGPPPSHEQGCLRNTARHDTLLSLGHLSSSPTTQKTSPLPAAVVGWPPIRSFRKKIARPPSSNDQSPLHHNDLGNNNNNNNNSNNSSEAKAVAESCVAKKGLFVKINMDGVPIGRKVDLHAYDSYPKLSSAVDLLFGAHIGPSEEEEKAITGGLLDGSGEYALVYENHQGGRMLVGDVPWKMFVSTVKRLRVLKSSELPGLRC